MSRMKTQSIALPGDDAFAQDEEHMWMRLERRAETVNEDNAACLSMSLLLHPGCSL